MDKDCKEEVTLRERVSHMLGIPVKLVLASSLVVLNLFSVRAQQQELIRILQKARDPRNISEEAKEELFNFYEFFKSSGSVLCPIMIREYNQSSEDEVYKSGLLINGEYQWGRALGAIRQHLKIEQGASISFFAGKHLIGSGNVLDFYEKHKSSDGILYMQYMKL